MQRRDFLKLVGLAAVAPSLPASEAEAAVAVPWVHLYTKCNYVVYDEFDRHPISGKFYRKVRRRLRVDDGFAECSSPIGENPFYDAHRKAQQNTNKKKLKQTCGNCQKKCKADPNAYNACPDWKPKTISAGS